eukprot:SAG22_NODE_1981_length_3210_cov_10.443909_3_plen_196_part_00
MTSESRLFVDFQDVAAQRGIRRDFHQAEKHGTKPVLVQEYPWERVGGMCGSVVFDEQDQLFKCWYMAGGYEPGGDPTLAPGAPERDHALHCVCLATSVDSISWIRPALRLHATDKPGLADNNIVIPGEHHHGMDHFETVLKDPTLPTPVREDSVAALVGWGPNLKVLPSDGRAFRLHFMLFNARVYSYAATAMLL